MEWDAWQFVGKLPNTRVRLTDAGRAAIDRHWQRLEQLKVRAQRWQSHESHA